MRTLTILAFPAFIAVPAFVAAQTMTAQQYHKEKGPCACPEDKDKPGNKCGRKNVSGARRIADSVTFVRAQTVIATIANEEEAVPYLKERKRAARGTLAALGDMSAVGANTCKPTRLRARRSPVK
jgi:hypothetical protein